MSMKIDAKKAEKLRKQFKAINKFMVLLWRLGVGWWFGLWPEGWGQIMVITHTGRKSGKKYRTPVNFAMVDEKVYCTAGFGEIADWYRNITANSKVEIWLPQGWWTGKAEDVSDRENSLEIMRAVIKASGFAGPMFGVNADQLDDESLSKLTRNYRLIQIQREDACTGPGGPADLHWIWQITTFFLILALLRRRRRK